MLMRQMLYRIVRRCTRRGASRRVAGDVLYKYGVGREGVKRFLEKNTPIREQGYKAGLVLPGENNDCRNDWNRLPATSSIGSLVDPVLIEEVDHSTFSRFQRCFADVRMWSPAGC